MLAVESVAISVDSWDKLLLGLLTGLVFGFLLQRGAVTKFKTIVGQFLLADFTVVRTMLTAVVVGSVGVLALHQFMDVKLHLKEAVIWGDILGGAIFGVGMAVLGYCPGTGVAAIGDGSRHAIWGVVGMLFGAAIYAEAEAWISTHILAAWDLGKVTIPQQTNLSPWIFVAALALVAVVVFVLLHGRDVEPGHGN